MCIHWSLFFSLLVSLSANCSELELWMSSNPTIAARELKDKREELKIKINELKNQNILTNKEFDQKLFDLKIKKAFIEGKQVHKTQKKNKN